MRGRIKVNKPPMDEPYLGSDAWPYMFTVVITSTNQDKARQTAENYHEYIHDAWNHRDQQVMEDTRLETTSVELM